MSAPTPAPSGIAHGERLVERLPGGVCAVDGVLASGVAAGLKASGRPDVALVVAPAVVPAAGVQTTNQVQAAPIRVTARHLAGGVARAVVLNSGSANACTGAEGVAVAEAGAARAAAALGCAAGEVLVCSTGIIGVPIPREPYLDGIDAAAAALTRDGSAAAARAILTTDLVTKEAAVRVTDATGSFVVGGIAKGSGMIAPSMATMLCVLTTDAAAEAPVLDAALRAAVDRTFNRITVDGSTSTNDAVLCLATGTAGRVPSAEALAAGLEAVCADLAEAVVRDGEGASRIMRVTVRGARSEDGAVAVARRVANDNLVKTALAGGDPNWGRVLGAVGATTVPLDPDRIAVAFGDVVVCRDGVATPFDHAAAAAAIRREEVVCTIDLGLGDAEAGVLTCDLTEDYIRINAEYTT